MMVDRSAKCLQVAACATAVATMPDIRGARLGIDGRQLFVAPEFIEAFNPSPDLKLVAGFADIGQIDRQYVSTVDVLDILPAALGLVLFGDVVR
ncbi:MULTISPECIES: hypothetical protein [unclassified Bradyrhizobium]|uniref:hypothetical protein n=1 Tax=unclassified Bradyrhizobium TaxID=2631580 RepID=UPI0028E52EAD|nr:MULTISPECIES: hypothetical protein [unclassified Bradyrhizobium]